MKSYEVIGIEKVEYVSKKTNETVHGSRLHLVSDFEETRTDAQGNCVEQVFTKCENANNVEVGDIIELFYNKYGSIEDLRVVSNN